MTDPQSLRIIRAVGRDLPSGTVTFLFTDVEGSTKLLQALGPAAYADALAEHRRILRDAFDAHGGVEVDTQGDAFFVAFPTAARAPGAAAQAQEQLANGPIKLRMGLHTGTPHLTDEGYVGADVHRAARIAAAGHGGQILVSATTAALLGTDLLRDLGEHRLKDLSAPERIYQLGTEEHPPLKTLHQVNLPVPATPFLGREAELREIAAVLARDGVRLVTLTGPGGTGKTRLALQAAALAADRFAGGVWWVPLAPLRDPALVAAEIALTIGAKEGLVQGIGDREMLLVLDNFEQLVAAAPELVELLERCPNLRLLVTSRELLRVRGETEFAVPPLATKDAVALFEARAGFVDADVPELCRRLDELPLAVELAAARARVLSPAQILDRLGDRIDLFRGGRDADARQATLRGAIEWSYELLDAEERKLFARLAVFHGGWTLDAAEEVTDARIDTLGSLAEKSLIRADDRFRMLETIRTYAEERLEASEDESSCRRRHLDYFLSLAEGWYEERFSSEPRLLAAVTAENGNLRAALEWASEHAPAAELALVGAMVPLWSLNGQALEAKTRLTAALGQVATAGAPLARALMHLGELDDDLPRLHEALAIWRELNDREGEAAAIEAIGWAHDAAGDYSAAEAAHEESLAVRRAAGSPDVRGLTARAGLCHVLVARSETGRAAAVAAELLAIARAHDATLMEELALHFLADCSLVDGDYAEAERRYLRALAYARDAGLVGRATDEVLGVAMARAGLERSADALRLAVCAHAKQVEIGKGNDAWWTSMQDRLLGLARTQLSDDERETAESTGRAASFDALTRELVSGGIAAHAPS